MTIKEKITNASNYALDRFLEATPAALVFNPVLGAVETFYNKLSWGESLSTRAKGTLLTYLGGIAFSAMRRRSGNKLNESYKGGLLGLVSTPPFYHYLSGLKWEDTAIPTLAVTILGFAGAVPFGWCMDAFKELACRGDSERLPYAIRSQSPTIKRSLAGALVASSLASLAAIYTFSPNNESVLPMPTTLEAQVISSP
jgi:hypothetical protein